MTFDFSDKGRHRRLRTIRDRRGLPAKRIPAARAARHFGQIMYWVKCNGTCVITEGGRPAAVLINPDHDPELTALIYARVAVAVARRRNPGGTFTLADEVFGSRACADWWMGRRTWDLAGDAPVHRLSTDHGVAEVLALLHRIQHGIFS